MEVKSATLDWELVAIENNQVTVGENYTHEAYYEGTTSQTKIMYVGVSNKIIPYLFII